MGCCDGVVIMNDGSTAEQTPFIHVYKRSREGVFIDTRFGSTNYSSLYNDNYTNKGDWKGPSIFNFNGKPFKDWTRVMSPHPFTRLYKGIYQGSNLGPGIFNFPQNKCKAKRQGRQQRSRN